MNNTEIKDTQLETLQYKHCPFCCDKKDCSCWDFLVGYNKELEYFSRNLKSLWKLLEVTDREFIDKKIANFYPFGSAYATRVNENQFKDKLMKLHKSFSFYQYILYNIVNMISEKYTLIPNKKYNKQILIPKKTFNKLFLDLSRNHNFTLKTSQKIIEKAQKLNEILCEMQSLKQ
ncbi:hypothetical protein [Helicobacter cetorum]|uniref:Uncharacterized protein n=2 Tax=Helicobacter cetorum TaxID=138563 RepID=I0EPM0_HELC0|nr:hypothetical protein [Helicobacter cetorum]ABS86822.1 hypothetical protein pz25w [Helicobacter cetorum]AFI04889.1 hypothetical protein HCW_08160 [Helicobacter cetorum MIT 00-7128]